MDQLQLLFESFLKIDVHTIPGLAIATAIIIESLKKFFPYLRGKEDLFAIVLSFVGGVILKVSGAAFADIHFVTFFYNIALASIGAQIAYDKVVKPFYGLKDKFTEPVKPVKEEKEETVKE